MDTKKKMSNRDKMMLFVFGAILIVAAAYFLVFAKMNFVGGECDVVSGGFPIGNHGGSKGKCITGNKRHTA